MRFSRMPVFVAIASAMAGSVNCDILTDQKFSLLPWRTVAQLDKNNTFLDNMAFRHNGDLIITENASGPNIYTVREPWRRRNNDLTLLHRLEDADGALGVAEVAPDHFIIATTKLDNGTLVAKSVTIQFVKLNNDASIASTGFVGRYPEFGLINGMIPLEDRQNGVLAADSVLGVIHKISPFTGEHEVVVDVPELKASNPSAVLQLGVNGIKIHNSYLYWSNTATVTVYRIAITNKGIPVKGAQVEVVSRVPGASTIDDIAIDARGNVWVAGLLDNNIVVLRTDGSAAVEVGSKGDIAVAGVTALGFGKTAWDQHILYATTNGGMVAPVNGTIVEPGKVAAIDTTSFYN